MCKMFPKKLRVLSSFNHTINMIQIVQLDGKGGGGLLTTFDDRRFLYINSLRKICLD